MPDQQPLPAKVVDQLLDRLSTDDSFRALFERNPEAAFERLGYPPTAEQLACCKPEKLADKATIQATREEMRERLILGSLAYRPNHWDSSQR
jgi:putative modified peptide